MISVGPFQLRLFSASVIDLLLLGQHLRKGPEKKLYLSTRYSREMYFKSWVLKYLLVFETKY